MERVVENQPQAPCQDLQFRHPLPVPPQCLGRLIVQINNNHLIPNLLQTLIKHIQRRFRCHPTKPTTSPPIKPLFLLILDIHITVDFLETKVLIRVRTQGSQGRREANPNPNQTALALLLLLLIATVIVGIVTKWRRGRQLGAPELLGELVERPIVLREHLRAEPAGEPGRYNPELLPQPAELLGELGLGVGLRHRTGEAIVKDLEVSGKGEPPGRAVQEALQEPNLVGLGPDPVELERRWLRDGVALVEGGLELGGEEIRVRRGE